MPTGLLSSALVSPAGPPRARRPVLASLSFLQCGGLSLPAGASVRIPGIYTPRRVVCHCLGAVPSTVCIAKYRPATGRPCQVGHPAKMESRHETENSASREDTNSFYTGHTFCLILPLRRIDRPKESVPHGRAAYPRLRNGHAELGS